MLKFVWDLLIGRGGGVGCVWVWGPEGGGWMGGGGKKKGSWILGSQHSAGLIATCKINCPRGYIGYTPYQDSIVGKILVA